MLENNTLSASRTTMLTTTMLVSTVKTTMMMIMTMMLPSVTVMVAMMVVMMVVMMVGDVGDDAMITMASHLVTDAPLARLQRLHSRSGLSMAGASFA